MNQGMIFLYIGLGGALGACSRYFIGSVSLALLGKGFPYGTLIVNILGSFIMGLLTSALERDLLPSGPWREMIGLGFLGALTTFSTFSMDNVLLLNNGEWLKLGLNMLLNVTICFFTAWLGFTALSRAM